MGTSQDDENYSLHALAKPYSPLMLASRNGHAKCVTLLLEKEADIGVKSECGYNCLMEAIKAGHKYV